ncbi:MAG: UDP-N-acetylglucosamine 2-epimerase (non-hydrolyzing) [Acidobacteriaceae bacterium]|nr:UDP-N-acetylglucosamine 2-epimerase (non-hydrolyzing) [Acidobacteriaceae bacterium]MBV9779059.1 UDP-N-acetylglucosamine 2-epimerase (non-hydrolyzing) [Acidobacteriaceae bacterium]
MKVIVVAGARPNFMKVAPILHAFARRGKCSGDIQVRFVHTGQHYDAKMSDDFLSELGIPCPDINLGVGSGSHAEQTARAMVGFESVCLAEKPDWVLVVGDVNSTLACSISAKKLGIAVAHVEAGLRSMDRSMPEEINRICTDAISDLLFTTDTIANENLYREGISPSRVHFVGNTMIDTLLRNLHRALDTPLPDGVENEKYAVLTLHRPANVDSPEVLASVSSAIDELSKTLPVVFPVHPRTRKNLREFGLMDRLSQKVLFTEPLSYLPFIGLAARSRMVLTDSGGIQEETTVLGVPCITMRANTERPITCTVGTNVLVGTDGARIRAAVNSALTNTSRRRSIPEKWDGHSGERIVATLLDENSLCC